LLGGIEWSEDDIENQGYEISGFSSTENPRCNLFIEEMKESSKANEESKFHKWNDVFYILDKILKAKEVQDKRMPEKAEQNIRNAITGGAKSNNPIIRNMAKAFLKEKVKW